jgi:hypothetical protein
MAEMYQFMKTRILAVAQDLTISGFWQLDTNYLNGLPFVMEVEFWGVSLYVNMNQSI